MKDGNAWWLVTISIGHGGHVVGGERVIGSITMSILISVAVFLERMEMVG